MRKSFTKRIRRRQGPQLRILSALAVALLFMACTTDNYDTGDGKYSYLRADFVEAHSSEAGFIDYALSDTADSLSFSTPLSASWATKGDSIYRALLYYNKVDAGAQPITISRVPVLQIQTTTRPDTLKTDPVAFESIWMSSNRKYLNLSLSIKTGKSDGQLVAQSIGLFRKETTAGHALYLQLTHNQNGVPEYYSSHVYLSIPMSRISAGTTLHLILNSYDGIIEREVTL